VILTRRVYLLRGQRRVRILLRPRILVPNHRIMAKAIKVSRSANREPAYPGEDTAASRAILVFQQQTQGLRLSDEAAADLHRPTPRPKKE